MEVQIADRTAEVELIEKNGNGIRLSVDGKAYDLDMVMTDRGICSVLCDGRSYDMEVERREGDTRQDNDLCAPMPGKVVRIDVAEGDRLQAGDTVVVFEAMKMQSTLKVTGDCIVREIAVHEGDTVAGEQLLVRLDVIVEETENQ